MKKKIIQLLFAIVTISFTINVNAETIIEKDNKKYCIDDNENIVTGFVEIEGNTYFFSRAKDIYGQMKYGWQDDGTHKFYLDEKTGVLQKNGLLEYNEKKYYANEEGYIQGGPIEIDGNVYFFSRAKDIYGQMKYGWQDDGTHKFYLDEVTGVLQKGGLFEYKNKKYYANEEGYIQGGPIEIDGNIYFFSRAKEIYGQMKYGWQDDGTHKFYLDEKTGKLQKNGLFEYNKKKYYANEEGYIQGGPIEIDGNVYFFSRAKDIYGQMKYGWQDDGTHKFYLDEKTGILQRNGLFENKNKKYYANEEGYIQGGPIEIEGNIYFFSRAKDIYGQMKYGWQDDGTHKFYLDEKTGILQRNGLFEYKNKKYYANEEGYIQGGFIRISDKIYFFSRAKDLYGHLKHGWQNDGENYWYQGEDGALVTGLQTINSREYKFNDQTGMLDGFKYENGKEYYYNPDGTLNKGIQYMTDKYWKFNETTGAFEKYVRQIRVIDISHHNGDINWDQVKASGMVDAVILRLGYGDQWFDNKFFKNKAELERLGIPYSIYLFSYAENKNEALAESNFVINSVRNHNINIATNIFSIYYDLEDWIVRSTGENSYGISKDTYGEMITTFVDNIERNLCIKARVYASEYYVYDRFPEYTYKYATWIANWTKAGITYPYNYEGWQFTSKANIPGIPWAWNSDTNQWEPHTDMSIFYY